MRTLTFSGGINSLANCSASYEGMPQPPPPQGHMGTPWRGTECLRSRRSSGHERESASTDQLAAEFCPIAVPSEPFDAGAPIEERHARDVATLPCGDKHGGFMAQCQ